VEGIEHGPANEGLVAGVCRQITALIFAAVLTACAENAPSLETNVQQPAMGTPAPATTPAPGATPSATVPADSAPSVGTDQYRLGPGDKLRILVFSETELSGEFVVGGGGAVDMPLIGAIEAQGASVREFQERVVAKLRDGYLKDPKVSVEVLNYRPFFITGEVKSGGEYPYKSGLTVQDAVGVAGGYSYRANTRMAYVRRAGQDREQEVDLKQRVPISPGDSIRIPERFF
jgi:protein involved in polysaccharide export with SLBB domain